MKGGRITIEQKSTLSIYIGVGIAPSLLTAGAIYFFVLSRNRNTTPSASIRTGPSRATPS